MNRAERNNHRNNNDGLNSLEKVLQPYANKVVELKNHKLFKLAAKNEDMGFICYFSEKATELLLETDSYREYMIKYLRSVNEADKNVPYGCGHVMMFEHHNEQLFGIFFPTTEEMFVILLSEITSDGDKFLQDVIEANFNEILNAG